MLLLVLAGCMGNRGDAGPEGPPGPPGATGPTGAAGTNGQSVTSSAVPAGHATCAHGGSEFVSASGTTYACSGAPGTSVTLIPLSAGADPACPSGGTKFVLGTTTSYACSASLAASTCPPSQTTCGANCRNLNSDPLNCGSCGTTCDSRTCVNGLCAKLVFTTRQSFTGALGGVAGGNSKCQSAAATVGLRGTYLAWLSDAQGNSPAASFTRSQAPYVTSNGAVVAANWSALLGTPTTPLASDLSLDEYGVWPAAARVWTGTNWQGLAQNLTSQNCDNWSSTSGFGYTGDWGSKGMTWTQAGGVACNVPSSLYCFEQ
jgi:hypothetical protein